jgi:hypothetical protein
MEDQEQGKSQVSRRSLLRTGAVTSVVAAAAAGGTFAAAGTASAATGQGGGSHRETSPAGDLILFNGRIHTVDSRGTVASVIAIRGGVIVYVGDSLQAARQQFSSAPQAIDLAGKVAVPGLIDCHNHFVLMGTGRDTTPRWRMRTLSPTSRPFTGSAPAPSPRARRRPFPVCVRGRGPA